MRHAPIHLGALAHLARAFDWQSKGDEFESRMLHMTIREMGGLQLLKSTHLLFIYLL